MVWRRVGVRKGRHAPPVTAAGRPESRNGRGGVRSGEAWLPFSWASAVAGDWVGGNGLWAPLVFFLLCATGTAAFFPKPVLAIASGLLFGILPGLAIAVVGFTAGALIAFFAARLLGRRSGVRWVGSGRLGVLDAVFARDGLAATLVLRLLPVIPFAVSNYGAGVTAVAPSSFAAGTALGLVPTTVLAATLGDAALDLDSPARSWQRRRGWCWPGSASGGADNCSVAHIAGCRPSPTMTNSIHRRRSPWTARHAVALHRRHGGVAARDDLVGVQAARRDPLRVASTAGAAKSPA